MDTIHDILRLLHQHDVEFVIVGGMAGIVHGSSVVTEDLDICAPFTIDNLSRLLAALADVNPRHRIPPQHPSLSEDPQTLSTFNNLYLLTDRGQLDVLSAIDNVGSYEQLAERTISITFGGLTFRVLDIDALIRAKEAMSRPKDIQTARELKALRERHHKNRDP